MAPPVAEVPIAQPAPPAVPEPFVVPETEAAIPVTAEADAACVIPTQPAADNAEIKTEDLGVDATTAELTTPEQPAQWLVDKTDTQPEPKAKKGLFRKKAKD